MGRHPILIGPNQLNRDVFAQLSDRDGIDILAFCPFQRVMSLLLTAEHAFYWNVVSHSILVRLLNGLPVVLFDRGHLARAIPTMYERVVAWYYQGWEPPYLDHRAPLTADALSVVVEDHRAHRDQMRQGYERGPAPTRMIDSMLAGSFGA